MRRRVPPAFALAAGLAMLCGVASAQPAAPPAALASPAAVAACPIDVLAVLPLHGDGITTPYAAFLASPRAAGLASGTLWINTSLGPFHVPFAQRMVAGDPYTSGNDPIVFALPAASTVQNVFVDTLEGIAPCPGVAPWVPTYSGLLLPAVRRAVTAAAKTTEAPASATPIANPGIVCHVPDVDARALKVEPVISAPDLRGGKVVVRVHLGIDSAIRSVEVDDPNSPVRYYNTRALIAARHSVFATAMVNCRPVESDYLFTAVFQ